MARVKKGLSLAELAKKSNVSVARISKIEKGETNFRLTTFFSIAEALEVKMNSLVGDKEIMLKRLLDID
jgi:transcriptional regulator with XRE-family HTH domain